MTESVFWGEVERRRLVRLCAKVSGDRAAAEDLAQETLLVAWRNRHKLVDPVGVDRWLSAVARNVCLRFLDRPGRCETPVAAVPEKASDVDLDDRVEDHGQGLAGALATLPEAARDVLVERYVHGRGTGEIARRLGISEDAASMRLTRGKVALRRALDESAWQTTGIWCALCGSDRLATRRERQGKEIVFRCPSCDGEHGRTAVFRLDNPTFAKLVGSLQRPTAMFRRVGDWANAYWSGGDGSVVACSRCTAATIVRAHIRSDTHGPMPGLTTRCDACGEELWSSLIGLTAGLSSVRESRRGAPGTSGVVTESREAITVRFGGTEAAFDRRDFRLLRVA